MKTDSLQCEKNTLNSAENNIEFFFTHQVLWTARTFHLILAENFFRTATLSGMFVVFYPFLFFGTNMAVYFCRFTKTLIANVVY